MKIEVKNIIVNVRFSEETTMFQGNLYVDGVKIATCSNGGRGGSTRIVPTSIENRKKLNEVEEYCKTLPSKYYEGTELLMDLELLVDDIVFEYSKKKEIERGQKKSIMFRTKDFYRDGVLVNLGVEKSISWKCYTIEQLVKNHRNFLKKEIKKLKDDGCTIHNTNIPQDLL